MDRRIILGIIVIIAITVAIWYGIPESKKVVLFYRPECIHCQRLMPEWNRFQQIAGNSIAIDKINVGNAANVHLLDKYNIQGVPTVILFKGDKSFVYDGDRTAEDILLFTKLV